MLRIFCSSLEKKLRVFSSCNERLDASTSRSNPPGKRCSGFGSGSSSKGLFDSILLNNIRYPKIKSSFPSLSITHSPSINTPIIGESITNPNRTQSTSELVKALELPQQHVGDKMSLCIRSISKDQTFIGHRFWITNIVKESLKNSCKSLGLVRKPPLELDTPTHLVEYPVRNKKIRKKWLVEVLTGYQGCYGHFIVLVSLGVGCTVWYTMGQNLHDIVPPHEIFNPDLSYKLPNIKYGFFMYDDYEPENFKKLDFLLESPKVVRKEVHKSINNVFPEMKMKVDNVNSHTAIGLGILISIFLATGLLLDDNPAQLIENKE